MARIRAQLRLTPLAKPGNPVRRLAPPGGLYQRPALALLDTEVGTERERVIAEMGRGYRRNMRFTRSQFIAAKGPLPG